MPVRQGHEVCSETIAGFWSDIQLMEISTCSLGLMDGESICRICPFSARFAVISFHLTLALKFPFAHKFPLGCWA